MVGDGPETEVPSARRTASTLHCRRWALWAGAFPTVAALSRPYSPSSRSARRPALLGPGDASGLMSAAASSSASSGVRPTFCSPPKLIRTSASCAALPRHPRRPGSPGRAPLRRARLPRDRPLALRLRRCSPLGPPRNTHGRGELFRLVDAQLTATHRNSTDPRSSRSSRPSPTRHSRWPRPRESSGSTTTGMADGYSCRWTLERGRGRARRASGRTGLRTKPPCCTQVRDSSWRHPGRAAPRTLRGASRRRRPIG